MILLAICIEFFIGYRHIFTLAELLTLATILSTTDPVAVVALLKELGAPLHIETLIEMESLLNDGIGVVFFTIFYNISMGENLTIWNIFKELATLSIGGPVIGIIFAYLCMVI